MVGGYACLCVCMCEYVCIFTMRKRDKKRRAETDGE